MTPEEFTTKLEELRAVISDKVTDLEENPKWGSQDERLEIVHALEELVVQVEGADRGAGGGGGGRGGRR